ncbi:MAG: diphthine synthase [Candidatus Thermoplasmatota archaeon]|jgi:diphthine synthase|nr:diphthine synthase [Candidatus Thermoplasmatota archaeon]
MNKGRLTFVGLGLYDEKDISLKGLDEIKNCDKVYAEFYTAKLVGTDIKKIEKTVGKNIEVLSRDETEKGDIILDFAKNKKVVFLTCGDPMAATTHVDLRLRAASKGIETKIVHGSSIMTAVPGLLGLQNYKFGRTTTLVFPEKNYFPISPYEVIRDNKKMGLHTLVLLDIQADKNRFMTANEGLELLLQMEKKQKENVLSEDSVVCVVAHAGSDKPLVVANSIVFLEKMDFGPPLHTIVVPGNLHFMEIESLIRFAGLPIMLGEKCKN